MWTQRGDDNQTIRKNEYEKPQNFLEFFRLEWIMGRNNNGER